MSARDSPAASQTVFLSYGRADARPLAEKLHADLTTRGFRIWQDRQRIRAGWSWDEEIQAGLRESRVLLAVMSPHSVRRAGAAGNGQDSVCLDEIAYARGMCRIPIVPVRAIACETPLLIYRLHAIDMTRWTESEEQYRAALDTLCDGLHAALRGETRERVWAGSLDPWDFAPFLIEKRRDFRGREWLFKDIDAWRRSPDASALLIGGEPGMGKSAIVAELVASNPGGQVLAYHCCQADTRATLEPGRFVRSVAAMLASRLDAYATLIDQPEIQDALSEARAQTDPGGAFEAGILAPLHRLPQSAVDEAVAGGCGYILVDALDEALALQQPVTIVDVLASRLQRLPAWLRVVATTRDNRGVRQRLAGLQARAIHAEDPRNVDDVRDHVLRRLASPGLSARVEGTRVPRERLVDALVSASDGNFLFVTKALEAVEAGQLTFAQIQTLPPGLGSLYRLFFARIFPDGEGAYAKARAVLQALVAAVEPLSRVQLGAATGIDAEDDLPAVLSRLSAFVPQHDGRYRLFHRSLFDWLTAWNADLDEPVAGEFFANPRKGHERNAAWGWAEHQKGVTVMSPYALRHLPRHLASAGRLDELVTLLTDWQYLEIKVEGRAGAATTIFDLIADLVTAVDLLPATHPRRHVLSLLCEAIRFDAPLIARRPRTLFQCCWNRCWWHDAPAAAHFFESGDDAEPSPLAPWRHSREKMSAFMETWRAAKEHATPGFAWLRALRPPHDLIGGPLRAVLRAHSKGYVHLALSADEGRLVSGGEWGSIRLWDMTSGAPLAVFDEGGSLSGVAFTKEGDFVIAIGDKYLRFLRADTLALERHYDVPGDFITASMRSPDGHLLALGHMDGVLRIVDIASRQQICFVAAHGTESVEAIAFAPSGGLMASGGGSGEQAVRLWRLIDDELHAEGSFASEKDVRDIVFSPDGQRVIWSESEGRIVCVPLQTGEPSSIQATSRSGVSVDCLAFHPDGRSLFFGSGDTSGKVEAEVAVLDLVTREIVRRLYGHTSVVLDLLTCRGGSALVSSGHDSTIRFWSLDDAQAAPELPWWERTIGSVAFSRDGAFAYTGSERSESVLCRKVDSGELVAVCSGHDQGVAHLLVTPNGQQLMVGDPTGVIRFWDLASHELASVIETGVATMREISLSPDGRFLAVLRYYGVVVMDARTGEHLLAIHNAKPPSADRIVFSEDSRLLAAMGSRVFWLVETEPARIVQHLESEEYSFLLGSTCAFADDNRTLVVEGPRNTVRVIDLATGSQLPVTEEHRRVFARAVDDFESPFGWGVGTPEIDGHPLESQEEYEMTLGVKRTNTPVAWIPLPWAHNIWTHPSGRIWALERYGELHIVQLEGNTSLGI